MFFLLGLCASFVSGAVVDPSSTNAVPTNDITITSISPTGETVTDFNDQIDAIVSNNALSRTQVQLAGEDTTAIELPTTSTAVRLPNNRLGLTLDASSRSVLPEESTVITNEKATYISLPTQRVALQVAEITDLSVESITEKAQYQQSISKLNYYEVSVCLEDLDDPVIKENIDHYTIAWGDGYENTYSTDQSTISHVYSNSGTYTMTYTIQDNFGYAYEMQEEYHVAYEGHVAHAVLVVDANKEVAAATSAGIGLAAFGVFALTETGKYKLLALLPLLIPLYTRVQKEDVLDQFVRGQIYGFIKTNPGVHYNQIRREIGVENGTLSYHLNILEKTELIKSRREGMRYRAFYPTGMRFPKAERFRLTDIQLDILDYITKKPGVNQKEIATKLEKKPQVISYNVKVLEQAELIRVEKEGRKTRCYPVLLDDDIVVQPLNKNA